MRQVTSRVLGARDLIALADHARVQRADDVRVISASEKRDRPLLTATVESVDEEGVTYVVRILLAVKGKRGRYWCACPDHRKRTNVCKHIIAVADRYVAAHS